MAIWVTIFSMPIRYRKTSKGSFKAIMEAENNVTSHLQIVFLIREFLSVLMKLEKYNNSVNINCPVVSQLDHKKEQKKKKCYIKPLCLLLELSFLIHMHQVHISWAKGEVQPYSTWLPANTKKCKNKCVLMCQDLEGRLFYRPRGRNFVMSLKHTFWFKLGVSLKIFWRMLNHKG